MPDYIVRDYESFRVSMLQKLSEKFPAYTDRSSTDAGVVILELLAHGLDILSYYVDILGNEVFLPTALEIESVFDHCYRMGYEPRTGTPSKVPIIIEKVTSAGAFTLPAGTRFTTKPANGTSYAVGEVPLFFELESALTIPDGKIGNEQTEGVYDYQAYAIQGFTVSAENLGIADGTANQIYKLAHKPVHWNNQLEIYTINNGVREDYSRRTSWVTADATSLSYIAKLNNSSETLIMFGNGVIGHKPVGSLYAKYRVCNGLEGNLSSDVHLWLDESNYAVKDIYTSSTPTVYGTDAETIDEMRFNAVASLRTQERAVTLIDFEDLAVLGGTLFDEVTLVTGGRKAKATLSGTTVTVNILPQLSNTMTTAQKDLFKSFLEERALLGITVSIADPTYVDVTVTVAATAHTGYDTSALKTSIGDALKEYFAVGNLDFGQAVYLTDIIAVCKSVEGVKNVTISAPTEDTVPTATQIIKLSADPTVTVS